MNNVIDDNKINFMISLKINESIDKLFKTYKNKYDKNTLRTLFLKSKTCSYLINKNTKYYIEPVGFICEEFEKEIN